MKRACPVCGSLVSKLLFEQRFQKLSAVGLLDGYDVVVCAECGAGFADGIPTQDVFDKYYRDLSKYEYESQGGIEPPSDRQRFHEIADELITVIPSLNARILELGCANGGLLAVLRERGFANVQGVDPSPGCARAAWDLYRVPVVSGSLFNALYASFDFIILVGVLEHVADVSGALNVLRRLLAPEGRVYVEVPDGSRLAGRPDAPFQEFSTEHINFFSTISLTNLFERKGFETIQTGKPLRQQNANTTCPAAFGVYQLGSPHATAIREDNETEAGLLRYIRESQSEDARIRNVIETRTAGRDILIWGTGTHTQRLLAADAFAGTNIRAFVDSNPKYQGHLLHGLPVISPDALHNRIEPILISSRGSQAEITREIRHHLGLQNELILLYEAL